MDSTLTPLRIGINALYMIPGGVGGTEIYLRSLLAALARVDGINEYFIFANLETDPDLAPDSPRFHLISCAVNARIRPMRICYEQAILPWLLAARGIDVLLNPGFTAPIVTPCPCVTVFHDLQHVRHPEFFRRRDLPFWRILLWLATARSRRLIAVSAATAADLKSYFPASEVKTDVIPHGVDPIFFEIAGKRRRQPAADLFILAVSTLHPHKNLGRLLEAFESLDPCHRLAIVGLRGFAAKELENCAKELGLGDRVIFTGWITRDEVYRFFEQASAFIAPSLFEGFGLPVLEALAAGLPAACSQIPAFDEIAGEAAIRFDPESVPAIRNALERITTDSDFRARAATAGPEQARKFDWNLTAARTLRVLTDAAARTSKRTSVRPNPAS